MEGRPRLELQHAQRAGCFKLDGGLLDMDRIARMAGAAVGWGSEPAGGRGVGAARRQCNRPQGASVPDAALRALRSEATIEIVNRAAMTSSETADGIL
jgi:hypothetical protein